MNHFVLQYKFNVQFDSFVKFLHNNEKNKRKCIFALGEAAVIEVLTINKGGWSRQYFISVTPSSIITQETRWVSRVDIPVKLLCNIEANMAVLDWTQGSFPFTTERDQILLLDLKSAYTFIMYAIYIYIIFIDIYII